jgi:hypothetical protein
MCCSVEPTLSSILTIIAAFFQKDFGIFLTSLQFTKTAKPAFLSLKLIGKRSDIAERQISKGEKRNANKSVSVGHSLWLAITVDHSGIISQYLLLKIGVEHVISNVFISEYGHSSLHAGLDDQRFGGQSKVPGLHLGPHHGNHQNHSDYGLDRRHRIEFLRHRSGQTVAKGDCLPAAGGLAFGRAQFPLRRPGQFDYLRPVVCRRHHLPSESIFNR